MKSQKKGDARGRRHARSPFLGHPDAKFFCGKRTLGNRREKEQGAGARGEIFSFCVSSLTEKLRSGPQQSRGTPFFGVAERTP